MINDLNLFGFLFELLVERDLRIYSEYNNSELRHFRNNVSGLKISSIRVLPKINFLPIYTFPSKQKW